MRAHVSITLSQPNSHPRHCETLIMRRCATFASRNAEERKKRDTLNVLFITTSDLICMAGMFKREPECEPCAAAVELRIANIMLIICMICLEHCLCQFGFIVV